MKKFLKIAVAVLLAVLLILIILPFVFKDKIMQIAKEEVNKTMYAKVDFEHLGLNFFTSFPNATVTLGNFYIAGINEFENDTLLYAKDISVTVNLANIFGNSGYEITRISADNMKVHAIVLKDGKANWDIVPESESSGEDSESNFQLLLKKVSCSNSSVYYDDYESDMRVMMEDINLTLTGDMTADETRIQTNATSYLTFIMDKIPYLSNARLNANVRLNADLKNMKFTLDDNEIQLNEVKASINGWVAMLEDESIDMDITLNAPSTQFKDILSLIPAIYSKDFKDLRTSGSATLEASAKGIMKDDLLPAFDAKMSVSDAMFQYPGMPKSVSNINANMHAYSKGGSMDNTIVDISRFHFEMGGNPFDLKLHLSTPMSDPDMNLSAVGNLNMGMIKEVYPLEDMELSGNLNANLQLATRMSYIENEQYDKVSASGGLNVKDMLIKSEGTDDIELKNASLSFSPRDVKLSEFAARIGKNDIAANGTLENFIPYFMKDEILKGSLTVSSNYLNLNDFMTETETAEADSASIGIIEIPQNLDLNLAGNFKQVIFDNMNMSDVVGQLIVKNGRVDMKNLAMNTLGGKVNVNGYYDTAKNPQQPEVSLGLDIKEVSFAQTFSTFTSIQLLAPIFESIMGNYSTNFQMTSSLGQDFMPDLASLTASGLLQSNNVKVNNAPVLNGLASALQNESLKELSISNLRLPFAISGGRVATEPFDVNFGGGKMNLSGTTGLDKSIDYIAKINLSDKLANSYLQNVTVKIGGSFTQPQFGIDTKDVANQVLGNLASSILGSNSSEPGATLTEQVDDQIEKQAENLRKQAKDVGDKLVAEAEKQGQRLIDEANKTSNPLAKLAAVKTAEAAAKRLTEEAKEKAVQLNEEAEKQIQNLGNR